MRRIVLAIPFALAIAPRDSAAKLSLPACPSCVAKVVVLSSTSITFDAPFNGAVPDAPTNQCSIEYELHGSTFTKRMGKTANSFSATVVALPPSQSLSFRLLCDGSAGPHLTTTTAAASGPLPKPPAIVAARRVGKLATFAFTSDPSAPTVFWPEVQEGKGSWKGLPDTEGTFATNKISVDAGNQPVRLGVRNSGGIVYSPAVP